MDDEGFGRIRSRGDAALFGGHTTQVMKERYGITKSRPLADFLPTLTIAAKNLATEMTNQDSLVLPRIILRSVSPSMSFFSCTALSSTWCA